MDKEASKLGNALSFFGRYFSNFKYLLFTLFLYTICALVTWIALLFKFKFNLKTATGIAYTLSTGGDPYSQPEALQLGWGWWLWFFLFHILSWLLVPVLIASAIECAHRTNEERSKQAERALLEKFEAIGREVLKLDGGDLESFISRNYREFKGLIEKK